MTQHVFTSPEQVRQDVDRLLGEFYKDRMQQAQAVHPRYGKLWEIMYQAYQAGGKRYRPYEVVLMYQALGGSDYQQVLPVAAAIELLHTGLLALDDVIDRDYFRHSQPNIAGVYLEEYKEVLTDVVECKHYADAGALLAENLLIVASQTLVQTAPLPAVTRLKAIALFDKAIFTVAGGELLDVEAPFVAKHNKADWRTIAERKTAHYTFITPLLLGATLAGASSKTEAHIRAMGNALGVAYQLADDMLGMFSTEAEIGKPAFSDLEEGKLTYLMIRTLEQAKPGEKQWLKSLLGTKPISPEDGAKVRAIMETSGARADAEKLIAQYVAEAKTHLKELKLDTEANQVLLALIDKVAWRRQ